MFLGRFHSTIAAGDDIFGKSICLTRGEYLLAASTRSFLVVGNMFKRKAVFFCALPSLRSDPPDTGFWYMELIFHLLRGFSLFLDSDRWLESCSR